MNRNPFFLFSGILTVIMLSCAAAPQQADKPHVVTQDNKKVYLDEFKGRLVIIDVWATWCGPCRMLIPELIKIHNMYGKTAAVVGISVDRGLSEESLKKFVKENKMNYPVGFGNPSLKDFLRGVSAIPTVFILDPQGKVIERIEGFDPDIGARIKGYLLKYKLLEEI